MVRVAQSVVVKPKKCLKFQLFFCLLWNNFQTISISWEYIQYLQVFSKSFRLSKLDRLQFVCELFTSSSYFWQCLIIFFCLMTVRLRRQWDKTDKQTIVKRKAVLSIANPWKCQDSQIHLWMFSYLELLDLFHKCTEQKSVWFSWSVSLLSSAERLLEVLADPRLSSWAWDPTRLRKGLETFPGKTRQMLINDFLKNIQEPSSRSGNFILLIPVKSLCK